VPELLVGYARCSTDAHDLAAQIDTLTRLGVDEYTGDLRELAERSNRDIGPAKRMLKEFKGIGDTGADIYLREVQGVWTWVRPYFDDCASDAAKQLGLPTEPKKLASLAPRNNARLAAALVRLALDDELRRQVTG
jgi:hypothetical protein